MGGSIKHTKIYLEYQLCFADQDKDKEKYVGLVFHNYFECFSRLAVDRVKLELSLFFAHMMPYILHCILCITLLQNYNFTLFMEYVKCFILYLISKFSFIPKFIYPKIIAGFVIFFSYLLSILSICLNAEEALTKHSPACLILLKVSLVL